MPTGQLIDSAWLSGNAEVCGGNPQTGPWVLGTAFNSSWGNYALPTQVNGQYPYYLSKDISASGTAFILNSDVLLDLNGHSIVYGNAPAITGINSEFENDAHGAAPAGWDLTGCPEAKPAVMTPANSGYYNLLFGNNVLAWDVSTGSQQLPASNSAVMTLDGSNNIIFTFNNGIAPPASGRQVGIYGFGVNKLVNQTTNLFTSACMYYVTGFAGSSGFYVSLTPGGSSLQAASVTNSAGQIGLAQVIRTGPIPLPSVNNWYGWHCALGSSDSKGWADGQASPIMVANRVYAPDNTYITPTKSNSFGNVEQGGGFRPYCSPHVFFPTGDYSSVYLEIAVASLFSNKTKSVWIDAARLNRAYDYGVVATPIFTSQFQGSEAFPTGMMWGKQYSYNKAKSFSLIDTAGGGSLNQGASHSFISWHIYGYQNGANILVSGLSETNRINMSMNGDHCGFMDISQTVAQTGYTRTIKNITCLYSGDIDIMNRQYFYAGINVAGYSNNILVENASFTNTPQCAINLKAYSPEDYFKAGLSSPPSLKLNNCSVHGKGIVANQYMYLFTSLENATLTNCSASGGGFGFGFYASNQTKDGTGGYHNITADNMFADMTMVPEREYGVNILMRTLKFKTVSPGPFVNYKNILIKNSSFTARCYNGLGKGATALQIDIRNGGGIGGCGNWRFDNCTFVGVIDSGVNPLLSVQDALGASFDQCDPNNFPTFYNCTFDSTTAGIWFNGYDGWGCHGSAAIKCKFKYSQASGVSTPYNVVKVGYSTYPTTNCYVLDPIFDNSVPSGSRTIQMIGSANYYNPYLWGVNVYDHGSNYKTVPNVTVNYDPSFMISSDPEVVPISGDAFNGYGSDQIATVCDQHYYQFTSGYINIPEPTVSFSVGNAAASSVLLGNRWPFKSVLCGTTLDMTVLKDHNGTPISGASVKVVDSNGFQWFPSLPGSRKIDNSNIYTGLTDPSGRVGVGVNNSYYDIPVIPIPKVRFAQGDAINKQYTSLTSGVSTFDGKTTFLTGSGTADTIAAQYTVSVSAPGYNNYTYTFDGSSPAILTAFLSQTSEVINMTNGFKDMVLGSSEPNKRLLTNNSVSTYNLNYLSGVFSARFYPSRMTNSFPSGVSFYLQSVTNQQPITVKIENDLGGRPGGAYDPNAVAVIKSGTYSDSDSGWKTVSFSGITNAMLPGSGYCITLTADSVNASTNFKVGYLIAACNPVSASSGTTNLVNDINNSVPLMTATFRNASMTASNEYSFGMSTAGSTNTYIISSGASNSASQWKYGGLYFTLSSPTEIYGIAGNGLGTIGTIPPMTCVLIDANNNPIANGSITMPFYETPASTSTFTIRFPGAPILLQPGSYRIYFTTTGGSGSSNGVLIRTVVNKNTNFGTADLRPTFSADGITWNNSDLTENTGFGLIVNSIFGGGVSRSRIVNGE